jgi:phospholipid/cholesterol/gamma-HCH transport system substrate-binding protein
MVADLRAITASMGEVTTRLRKGEGSMGRLLTDDGFYQRLDTLTTRLDTLIGRMERGEGSLGRLVQDPEFYNNLNGAATDVRTLIADVRKDPQKYLRVKLSVF